MLTGTDSEPRGQDVFSDGMVRMGVAFGSGVILSVIAAVLSPENIYIAGTVGAIVGGIVAFSRKF